MALLPLAHRTALPATHRAYLIFLVFFLAAASLLGTLFLEKEGRRAIWRNTSHTSDMMTSLLGDQTQHAVEKLKLIYTLIDDDPALLAALAANDQARLAALAKALKARSGGLITDISIYALDGRPLFGDHRGDSLEKTNALTAAMKSGKLAHGIELHSDDDVHVHLAGPLGDDAKPIAYVNLATTINDHLDEINDLLRLETEQHAAAGHRGDTAIGIFSPASTPAGAIRPLVTTRNFPKPALPLVARLIAGQSATGETPEHQFSLAHLDNGFGATVGTAVLALDVKTASEANRERSLRYLAIFLTASLLIVVATHLFMTRAARRELERRMELENLVDERTAELRTAQENLRDQNANLETQVYERTASLAEALVKAEAATRAKSEFLANMSHEIRTPMNAVIGLTSLCLHEDLSTKVRGYVAKTHGAAIQLLGIINDILDISKVEAGKLTLERISFSLDAVIENIANINGIAAAKKHLELIIDVAPATPVQVTGDPLRLGQVLNNLVSNAIKFTERGTVTLRVRPTNSGRELEFAVVDTGIGLDEEQIDRLFSAFAQADSSSTRRYGGTGLGLVISQRLVSLMGGRIGVSAIPGGGSTFSFAVGLGPAATGAAAADATPPPLRGKTVRIAEATPEMARIMGESLTRLGAEIVADDAADLVVAASLDVARAALAAVPAGTRIIATVPPEENTRAAPAAIHLLSRPVTRSSLGQLATRLLDGNKRQDSATEVAPIVAPDLSGRRVLLVDDNELNQLVGSDLLALTGVVVGVAGNGREAVEATSTQSWDLVLMDIQMPIMDGFAATLAIRQQPRNRALPIVAMTAHALEEERQRCKDAGMNDFITKPVSPAELFRVMQLFLCRESTPGAATPPAAAPEFAGPPATDDDRLKFDPAAARTYFPGGETQFRKSLGLFLASHRSTAEALRCFATTDSREQLRELAHKLKGSVHYVGAAALRALAVRLEETAAQPDGEWHDAAMQLAAGLDHIIDQIDAYQELAPG